MCEYINREGSRDHSKWTEWTAGMVQFIDWGVLRWLSVRQCLKYGHIHLETVPQTGSKLLGTMRQTGRQSLGENVPHRTLFTWRKFLNVGDIHIVTVPQTQSKYVESVPQAGSQ